MHGPDFPGAQPAESAARELGIRYPVAENKSKATWQAYGIGARPAWALIGADGSLLHRQIGKVTTDEVRERIEAALAGG